MYCSKWHGKFTISPYVPFIIFRLIGCLYEQICNCCMYIVLIYSSYVPSCSVASPFGSLESAMEWFGVPWRHLGHEIIRVPQNPPSFPKETNHFGPLIQNLEGEVFLFLRNPCSPQCHPYIMILITPCPCRWWPVLVPFVPLSWAYPMLISSPEVTVVPSSFATLVFSMVLPATAAQGQDFDTVFSSMLTLFEISSTEGAWKRKIEISWRDFEITVKDTLRDLKSATWNCNDCWRSFVLELALTRGHISLSESECVCSCMSVKSFKQETIINYHEPHWPLWTLNHHQALFGTKGIEDVAQTLSWSEWQLGCSCVMGVNEWVRNFLHWISRFSILKSGYSQPLATKPMILPVASQ